MNPYFNDGRDWFFTHRFGLFLHWGLYALTGEHEQVQQRRNIPRAEYGELIKQFNPVNYHPDAWLDMAQRAGMNYVCLTAKHHDGFCLWDSPSCDFNVMHSPYGRDVVGMLAEACHKRNMPLCLYYSVVDWHHRNYPNAGRSHELSGPVPGDEPSMERYMNFLRRQVRELCTQYGEIHGFWWDMNSTGVVDPSINQMIRQLQPNAVINNRGFDEGDYGTPEREWDEALRNVRGFEKPVQACNAVSAESWGYREDDDCYTDRQLIGGIDKYLSRGGSYLLNVGPKPDGTIRDGDAAMLDRIGRWYHAVEPALLAEPCSHLTDNAEVLLTRDGQTIYVHLHQLPTTDRVYLPPFSQPPRSATLLNTGQAVRATIGWTPNRCNFDKFSLRLSNLPVNELSNEVPVIALQFDQPIPANWPDDAWPRHRTAPVSQFGE